MHRCLLSRNLKNEEAMARVRPQRHRGKNCPKKTITPAKTGYFWLSRIHASRCHFSTAWSHSAYDGTHIVRLLTSGRTNNRGRNPIVCCLIPGWLCVWPVIQENWALKEEITVPASRYVGNLSSFTERARRDSPWETRGVCVKQKTREFRNLQPNGYIEKENDRSQHLMERNVKTKFDRGLL